MSPNPKNAFIKTPPFFCKFESFFASILIVAETLFDFNGFFENLFDFEGAEIFLGQRPGYN